MKNYLVLSKTYLEKTKKEALKRRQAFWEIMEEKGWPLIKKGEVQALLLEKGVEAGYSTLRNDLRIFLEVERFVKGELSWEKVLHPQIPYEKTIFEPICCLVKDGILSVEGKEIAGESAAEGWSEEVSDQQKKQSGDSERVESHQEPPSFKEEGLAEEPAEPKPVADFHPAEEVSPKKEFNLFLEGEAFLGRVEKFFKEREALLQKTAEDLSSSEELRQMAEEALQKGQKELLVFRKAKKALKNGLVKLAKRTSAGFLEVVNLQGAMVVELKKRLAEAEKIKNRFSPARVTELERRLEKESNVGQLKTRLFEDEIKKLKEENAQLKDENHELKNELFVVRNRIASLEKKSDEGVAKRSEGLREAGETAGELKISCLPTFPTFCKKLKVSLEYEESFLIDFGSFSKKHQKKIFRTLDVFSKEGPEYRAFRYRYIQEKGFHRIWVSHKIRLIYKKENGKLVFSEVSWKNAVTY